MAKHIELGGNCRFLMGALQLDGYNPVERSELGDRYEKNLDFYHGKRSHSRNSCRSINKEVIINVGYRSEGVVPATEFRYNARTQSWRRE